MTLGKMVRVGTEVDVTDALKIDAVTITQGSYLSVESNTTGGSLDLSVSDGVEDVFAVLSGYEGLVDSVDALAGEVDPLSILGGEAQRDFFLNDAAGAANGALSKEKPADSVESLSLREEAAGRIADIVRQQSSTPDDIAFLRRSVRSEDPVVRRVAAYAMGEVGANDPLTVDLLLSRIDDPVADVRAQVIKTLGGAVGRESGRFSLTVRAMSERFNDPDVAVRFAAVDSLRKLFGGNEQLDDLLSKADSGTPEDRAKAIFAIGELRFLYAVTINAFGRMIPYEVSSDVLTSANILNPNLLERWQSSGDVLKRLAKDPDANVAAAVFIVNPKPDKLRAYVQRLSRIVTSELVTPVKCQAVDSLGNFGFNGPLDVLFAALLTPDNAVRNRAAVVLVDIANTAPANIRKGIERKLIKNLAGADPTFKLTVVQALADKIEPNQLRSILGELFAIEDPEIRVAAIWVAESIHAGEFAASLIQSVANDENPNVREAAEMALKSIEARKKAIDVGLVEINTPRTRKILLDAAKDQSPEVRAAVAASIGHIGATESSMLDTLREMLRDQSENVRVAAADSFGLIAVNDDATRETLIALLEDPVESVRIRAMEALNSMRAQDADTSKAIRRRFYSYSRSEIMFAIEVIGRLNAPDADTIADLFAMANHHDSAVADTARGVLKQFGYFGSVFGLGEQSGD